MASSTKLRWQLCVIGEPWPGSVLLKYCWTVEKVPASGVKTAAFFSSPVLLLVSVASSDIRPLYCVAESGATVWLTTPLPVMFEL